MEQEPKSKITPLYQVLIEGVLLGGVVLGGYFGVKAIIDSMNKSTVIKKEINKSISFALVDGKQSKDWYNMLRSDVENNYVLNIAPLLNGNFTMSFTVMPCKQMIAIIPVEVKRKGEMIETPYGSPQVIKVYDMFMPQYSYNSKENVLMVHRDYQKDNKKYSADTPHNIVIKRVQNQMTVNVDGNLWSQYTLNSANIKLPDTVILIIANYGKCINNIKFTQDPTGYTPVNLVRYQN